MTAAGWKNLVQRTHPNAIVLNERQGAARTSCYIVRVKVDGAELGRSVDSPADAWRVAYINITSNRPPSEGPGTALLL